MKNIQRSAKCLYYALMVISMLSVTGCTDTDFDFESHYYKEAVQQYEKNFYDKFGKIDPSQDWIMTKALTADIQLKEPGSYTVSVFTENPIKGNARRLVTRDFEGSSFQFMFDASKRNETLFVEVFDRDKNMPVFDGYSLIKENVLTVSDRPDLTRAPGDMPTVGDPLVFKTYLLPASARDDISKLNRDVAGYPLGQWDRWERDFANVENVYLLNNWQSAVSEDEPFMLGDLAVFMRSYENYLKEEKNGVFKEGESHMELIKDGTLTPNVGYTMDHTGGEITLSYVFKGTAERHNYFGYYYYPSDQTITADNFQSIKKYVICPYITGGDGGDANEDGNLLQWAFYDKDPTWELISYDDVVITYPDWDVNHEYPEVTYTNGVWGTVYHGYSDYNKIPGMSMPTAIQDKTKDNTMVKGSKMKLVYFGPDGNGTPTYTFPANYKVGFFLAKVFGEDNGNNKMYTSSGELNRDFINTRPTGATFVFQGKVVLGMEDQDYGDNDIDDILFFVDGNFERSELPDMTPPDLASPVTNTGTSGPTIVGNESFIFAFEDLGATDDFDFNDVVFSVSNPDARGMSIVKLLAAGGTMESRVLFDGQPISFGSKEEVHQAFGYNDLKTMVNTGLAGPAIKGHVPQGTVNLGVGETVSNNASKFAIEVKNRSGETKAINIPNSPGKIPQGIMIGDNKWEWPYERVNLVSRYPGFLTWVGNSLHVNWYDKVWFGESTSNGTHQLLGAKVTLEVNKDRMNIGETADITYQTTSDATSVTIISSDTNVAEVVRNGDRYELRAKDNGTVEVIITVPQTEVFSAVSTSVFIAIGNSTAQNPNLSVTPSSFNMAIGGTTDLAITTRSNGTLRISNSDPTIVGFTQEGKTIHVTARKAGEATITIVQDADGEYSSSTKIVHINVTKKSPNLSVSPEVSSVAIRNTTDFTISTDSPGSITITDYDSNVAGVAVSGNTITVTGKSVGTTTLTVNQAEANDYEAASKQVTINVTAKADPQLIITPSSADIVVGRNKTFSFTTLSDGEITIQKSNANVSFVRNGNTITVTADALGSTTISVAQAETDSYEATVKYLNLSLVEAPATPETPSYMGQGENVAWYVGVDGEGNENPGISSSEGVLDDNRLEWDETQVDPLQVIGTSIKAHTIVHVYLNLTPDQWNTGGVNIQLKSWGDVKLQKYWETGRTGIVSATFEFSQADIDKFEEGHRVDQYGNESWDKDYFLTIQTHNSKLIGISYENPDMATHMEHCLLGAAQPTTIFNDNCENGKNINCWGNSSTAEQVTGGYNSNYCYRLYNKSQTANDYEVQASKDVQSIVNGKTYRLTLRMKGDGQGDIDLFIQNPNGYANVCNFKDNQTLTNTWQEYTYTATCTGDGGGRLIINFGKYRGNIYLDDIKLEQLN